MSDRNTRTITPTSTRYSENEPDSPTLEEDGADQICGSSSEATKTSNTCENTASRHESTTVNEPTKLSKDDPVDMQLGERPAYVSLSSLPSNSASSVRVDRLSGAEIGK